jgi:hypothetical protein
LANLSLDWGEIYRQRNDLSGFTQAFWRDVTYFEFTSLNLYVEYDLILRAR